METMSHSQKKSIIKGIAGFFPFIFITLIFLFLNLKTIFSQTNTYSYTGGEQTWTVPCGVSSITIKCYGAQGGANGSATGGQGGYATGTLAVAAGQIVYIEVGGQGGNTGAAGWNGGGAGIPGYGRAGGGGASDVRYGGNGLSNRVIVAGGGGGACTSFTPGGAGGGTNGGDGARASSGYAGFGAIGGVGGIGQTNGSPYNGTLGQGGTYVTLLYSGGGGGWYGGGAGLSGGGGSGYIGGVTSSSMTVGGQTGNGKVTITYTVSSSTPTITGISPPSTCAGSGATITINGTNFVTGATVTFTGASAVSCTVVNSTQITVALPAGASTGNVIVTTCTASNGYSLTVNAKPAAPTLAVVNNCGNSTLTATNVTGTLTWSDAGTGNPRTVTSTSAVTVQQTVGGCISAASNSVTPAPLSVPLAPTLAVVNNCGNSTLTATNGTGTLTWSDAGTGNPRTVTSTSAVTVQQTVGGCISAASNSVTPAPLSVPSAPTLAVVNNCGNSTLTATNVTGTLTWSDAGTGNPRTVTSTSAVTVQQIVGGCISAASNSVTPAPLSVPSAPTSSTQQSFCSATSPTLANLSPTGTSIKWYDAASGGNLLSGTALINGTHYYASQTVSSCESSSRLDVTATVNQPSSGTPTASATATTICNGQSTSLILIGGTPGTNSVINWYTGSCTTGTPVGTGNSLSVSPTTTTTYYGRYEDLSPCSSNSSCGSVTITINQPSSGAPTASATSPTICSGQNTNLSLSGGTAGTNSVIHWYSGSCGGTAVGTGNNCSTGTLTSTTTFYGRYEDNSPCSSNSSCGSVIVNIITPSYGTASNTSGGGSTQTICYNTSPASMSASGATGSSSYSYQWFSHPGAVTPTSGSLSHWDGASGTGNDMATFSVPDAITGTTTYACWVTPGGISSCGSANWAGANNNDNIQVMVESAFNGGSLTSTTRSICYNTQPSAITYSTAPSGGTTPTFQWYYLVGSHTAPSGAFSQGSWTAIGSPSTSDPTLAGAIIGNLSATTTFALRVYDGGSLACYNNWAGNAQVITVGGTFSGGTLTSTTQTSCYNANPSDITYSTAPGGGSNPTFQWYYLVGNQTAPSGAFSQGSWTAIGSPSTSTPTLAGSTIGNLTATTTFALEVYDASPSSCFDNWAGNAQVITIDATFSAGTISSGGQVICNNTQPSNITYSTAPTGGTVTTFQWYYLAGSQTAPSGSFSQGSWTAIGSPSTSTPSLTGATIGNLTGTTTFALRVYDGGSAHCFDNWNGDSHIVTVRGAHNGGTISSSTQSICYNTTPSDITYSASPSGGTSLSYQWYTKTGTVTAPSGNWSLGSWTTVGSSGSSPTLLGTIIGTLSTPGTYTYALRATDGGGTTCFDVWNGDRHVITVYPDASMGTVTGTTPLCILGQATYSANPIVLGGGTGVWSSDNTSMATVNSSTGVVTAVASGTCNIKFTITGGCNTSPSGQQALTINQNAQISGVSGTTPLCVGASATYTTSGLNLGGGTGGWSSDNTAIATVNSSGVVTGVDAGTTYIVYSISGCGGAPSAKQLVTIDPNASIGSVTGTSPLCIGATATYNANTVNLGGTGSGAWSSDNTAIATVDASTGVVTGVASGSCHIKYTITGGCGGVQSAQQVLTIHPVASIGSVTGTTPLCINANATYHANTVNLSGGAGSWSSDNTDIATVDASSGVVTGVSDGTCNIIYTINGGCGGGSPTAQQAVTINLNSTIVGVSGASTLCIGATATYTTSGVIMGGGTGAWSSTATGIATVDASSGVVTGVAAGSCYIVYTITGCGGTPTAKQKVTVNTVASIGSVTGTSPICIGATETYSANNIVLGGGTGVWSSDGSTIATVNSIGVVTGVSAGSCHIIYTISGGCGGTVSDQQALAVNSNSWIGTVSTDWNNASNWCNGIPTSATDVVIPSGTTHAPHVTSLPATPAVCNNLTINSGAVLTVDAGKALTVNGTTTLASPQCLVLKAASGQAAGGTGSFIDNGITGSGTAKVEKYLSPGRYWYIGSPIVSTAASDAYGTLSTVPSTGTRDFYWKETTHAYVALVNTDILQPTRGYAFEDFGSSPITATYIGTPNTGQVTAILTYTSGTKQGFNLVSNPYPSAINWGSQNSPQSGLTQTNLEQTIQYKVPGTYATWNSMGSGTGVNGGGQYIPAMQAFWVRVAAGNTTGSIQFTNAIRVHSAQAAYKLGDPPNVFRMQVARDTLVDESVVTFYAAALGGFEDYDSPKMLSDEPAYPQLYSYTTNAFQVAVNGQPVLVTGVERIIPLGFLTNVAGNFKITATNLAQFDANTTVYLEDTQIPATVNLTSDKTYTFTSATGTFNSRFKLHFNYKNTNPLPIQLLSFDAKCKDSNVDLNWSTATETNNDYFTIEKSADATYWDMLKKVQGAGNSNSVLNYTASDNTPFSGVSYYRLKQTDYNGHSETFSPVAVNCADESSQVDISYYPNPFTSQVYAVINNSISENATVSVYNILGSKVYTHTIGHDQLALKSFSLDLSGLVNGIYFIEFKSDTYSGISKIVKN